MTVQEGEFTSDPGDAGIIFCSSPREEDVSPRRSTKIGKMGSKNQLPRKCWSPLQAQNRRVLMCQFCAQMTRHSGQITNSYVIEITT
jgi:hypothetical protein